MSEFEDRINSVLNDPEQMDKIANLAKSLMGGGDGQGADAGDGGMMGKLGELAKGLSGGGSAAQESPGRSASSTALTVGKSVSALQKGSRPSCWPKLFWKFHLMLEVPLRSTNWSKSYI